MVKRINGDLYSDLITRADPRQMASGGYPRLPIDTIVIHHNSGTNTEGALTWWSIDAKDTGGFQTSAHYQIDNDQIIGAVGEETAAWHAGNANMNQRSIGIEHVNSTTAPDWLISDKTFESSAKLIADLSKRYNIPIDDKHVIGHKTIVETDCPGGIDLVKLRERANEIKNGVKPMTTPKAGQVITTKKSGQLQNAKGTGKLTPENKANNIVVNKGTRVTFKKQVGNAYQVEYYGLILYLHKSQF